MSMNRFGIWLHTIRPKTLGASIAPVVLGSAIASNYVKISYYLFAATLLGAILLQIGCNLVNDYFDYKKGADTDERKGPIRAVQAGQVTLDELEKAIGIVFSLAILIGGILVWIGGLPILAIGILSIFCAVAYTAGPYPLAYVGLGDLFVFVFFGPVAVCGTFYLQTLRWDFSPFLASIPIGMLAVAILTVNNIRDIDEDTKSHKKTLVVRLGSYYGKMQYTFCLLLSLLLPIIYYWFGYSPRGSLLSLFLFFLSIPLLRSIWHNKDHQFNKLLAQTSQILILYGFVNAFAWFI